MPTCRCNCNGPIRSGQWNDPRAGKALGELALRFRDDRFITAAVLSSVTPENLPQVLATVLDAEHHSRSRRRPNCSNNWSGWPARSTTIARSARRSRESAEPTTASTPTGS